MMEYLICNKCNTVCNKYRVVGHYELNNKVYVDLEYICKCKNIMNKFVLSTNYYNKSSVDDGYNKA